MNKVLQMFGIFMIFLTVLTSVKATPIVTPFCTDSDGGTNIWTAGVTTDAKGANADDCDGASENLKEFYCDGTDATHDNIKCSDFNAVCISVGDKSVPDYCACDTDYTYDAAQNTCVKDTNVPEFGAVAGAVTLVGALGIFLFRRK